MFKRDHPRRFAPNLVAALLTGGVLIASLAAAQDTVRFAVSEGQLPPALQGQVDVELQFQYGASQYYRAPRERVLSMTPREIFSLVFIDDTLRLPGLDFDPATEDPPGGAELPLLTVDGSGFFLAQPLINTSCFRLPGIRVPYEIRSDLDFENRGCLLWVSLEEREALERALWTPGWEGDGASPGDDTPAIPLSFFGGWGPTLKTDRRLSVLDEATELDVIVLRGESRLETERLVEEVAESTVGYAGSVGIRILRAVVAPENIVELARRPDVVLIRPADPSVAVSPDSDEWFQVRADAIVVPADGVGVLYEQDSFRALRVTGAALDRVEAKDREEIRRLEASFLVGHPFDPLRDELTQPPTAPDGAPALHVVQFPYFGPREEWQARVAERLGSALGVDPFNDTAPDGASFYWAEPAAARALDTWVVPRGIHDDPSPSDPDRFLLWASPLPPELKMSPELWSSPDSLLEAEIVLVRHPGLGEAEADVVERASGRVDFFDGRLTRSARAIFRSTDLRAVAERVDVLQVLASGDRPWFLGGYVAEDEWLHVDERNRKPEPYLDLDPSRSTLMGKQTWLRVYRIEASYYNELSSAVRQRLDPQSRRIALPFDLGSAATVTIGPGGARDVSEAPQTPSGGSLHLIQPLSTSLGYSVRGQWWEDLRDRGAHVLNASSRSGWLVWTESAQARRRLDDLMAPAGLFASPNASAPPRWIDFHLPLTAEHKIAWGSLEAWSGTSPRLAEVRIARASGSTETVDLARQLAWGDLLVRGGTIEFPGYVGWFADGDLVALARRPDVVSIGAARLNNDAVPIQQTSRVFGEEGILDPDLPEVQRLGRGDGWTVYRLSDEAAAALPPEARTRLAPMNDLVRIGSYELELGEETLVIPAPFQATATSEDALYVIAAIDSGFRQSVYREAIESVGARIVLGLDRDAAYIVMADRDARQRLEGVLALEPFEDPSGPPSDERFLRAIEPYHPIYRVPYWVASGELPVSELSYFIDFDRYPWNEDLLRLSVHLAKHETYNPDTLALIEPYVVEWQADTLEASDPGGRIVVWVRLEKTLELLTRLAGRPDVLWAGPAWPLITGGPSGAPPSEGGGGGPGPSGPGAPPTAIPALDGSILFLLACLLGSSGWLWLRKHP